MVERGNNGEEIISRCRFAREARFRLAEDLPRTNCQHPKCDVVFSVDKWKGMPYCSLISLELERTQRFLERDRVRLLGRPYFERVIGNYKDRLERLNKEASDLGISSLD